MFDFLFATQGEDNRLLDFGPGDGWPSLIVAPYAREIVGGEGSRRRQETCTGNAKRLGISNAQFVYVEPGRPLPLDDETFDGVMAASSVEQTPDPQFTLRELYRVLRPGGRLRMRYEDLDRYRDGRMKDAWLWQIDKESTRMILTDRHIDEEYAVMYAITVTGSPERLGLACGYSGNFPFDQVTTGFLESLRPDITETLVCRLTHPSGRTLVSWLEEIGFAEARPTHSGAWFAGELFEKVPEPERPTHIEAIDALLKPIVGIAVEMAAPLASNPPITAVK
jgi:SAM-dependent methyltransferase